MPIVEDIRDVKEIQRIITNAIGERCLTADPITRNSEGDGIAKAAYGFSRANTVRNTLRKPMCFGLTSQGNPRHPLYLPKEAELSDYCEAKQALIAQKGYSEQ